MIEGVAGVGVAQPMRGNWNPDASSLGSQPDDHPDPATVQYLSASGRKHRRFCSGIAAQAEQLRPQGFGQGDATRAGALAESGELAGGTAKVQISPSKAARFGDSQASEI
jgi:hypothetical protein